MGSDVQTGAPAREPGGSLRDRRMMEPQPEVRADLGDRLRGILEG